MNMHAVRAQVISYRLKFYILPAASSPYLGIIISSSRFKYLYISDETWAEFMFIFLGFNFSELTSPFENLSLSNETWAVVKFRIYIFLSMIQ